MCVLKPQRLVAIAKFNTCKWFSIKSKRVMTFLTHELSKQRGDKSNFDDKVQVASKKKKIKDSYFTVSASDFCPLRACSPLQASPDILSPYFPYSGEQRGGMVGTAFW